MSGQPGYVFRDGGTTPPLEQQQDADTEFRQRITKAIPPPSTVTKGPLAKASTTSHELATSEYKLLGVNTLHSGIWQANGEKVPTMSIYHVKQIPAPQPGGLDLHIADKDDFSPDKIRSNIERVYMTVIVGLISFGKHIVRLRSWREPKRTISFAVGYFLAWLLNMVIPSILLFLIVLITVPRVRQICFPHAPIALINHHTGGIQKPKAGVLGSHDSVTGAPEKYKGEAVEQEASNLVTGLATVAIASAAGRNDHAEPDEKGGSKIIDAGTPDPTNMASAVADAASNAQGGTPQKEHDKTKQPMEEVIWAQMRPFMHILGDIADGWERFANALSPTAPFSRQKRVQLAAIVAPLLLLSLVIRIQWVMRGAQFGVGAAFFADPLIQRGIKLLNEKIPDWPRYLEIRNTLLKGVPTDAQLTITLLRIGEANRSPLPPPPKSNEPPPDEAAELNKDELTEAGLDASHHEIEDAITVDEPTPAEIAAEQEPPPKKKGFGQKLLGAFRTTTAAGVETKLTTDVLRAKIGSKDAKKKLGILPSKKEMRKKEVEGPIEFTGRYKGRKGAVYIDSSVSPASGKRPASPCVYFTTHLDQDENVESMPADPDFAVAIADIAELKKIGGLGWKGKIIVGWATNREVKDGIEITNKLGKTYRATALKERDELFNRLISMGQQVWESY